MPTTRFRRFPGLGLTMGYALSYLGLIVIIPLAMLFVYAMQLSWVELWQIASSRRLLLALSLSLTTALSSAVLNGILGFILAWVLTRYTFPGRRIIDMFIDMPFALPTAVAGITLTGLYASNGLLGQLFPFKIIYTPLGITLAMLFVTLPFVVRTLQPTLEQLPKELEEAAEILGASRWKTFFHIILPTILPAWITGTTLALARALGEYGSVVFIAGNRPFKTEILPLLIITELDQYNYSSAVVIGLIMLLMSFILLLLINFMQSRIKSRKLL